MMYFKKTGFKFIAVLLMALFIFGNGGLQVYAANIGDFFNSVNVEEGWKRYDDRDKNIAYLSDPKLGKHYPTTGGYVYGEGKTYVVRTSEESVPLVKFNFTGTKLRILGVNQTEYKHDNIEITIDNKIVEYFGQYIEESPKTIGYGGLVLNYEKIGLDNKEHSVIIKSKDKLEEFLLDAIVVDEDGVLLPFKETSTEGKSIVVLDVEPEKEKIRVNEDVYTNLVIDNIKEIAAEDIRIKYDNEKLQYIDYEEVDGMKLVHNDEKNGELRLIIASKGESNIVNDKKVLLKLRFKGISTGEALVDITKGRVSDGIEMEKDLKDEECDEATIIIEGINDVNNSGEFTLLDLGIDARHLNKDPKSAELAKYNTDIVINNAIDEDDLLEVGKFMLSNPNYEPNK